MYGYPGFLPVISLGSMIEIVKGFQIVRPLGTIALWLKGKKLIVDILPNGYLLLDGAAPSLAAERELDQAISEHGASLELLPTCAFALNLQPDALAA